MNAVFKLFSISILMFAVNGVAQTSGGSSESDTDQLRIAMVEALMTAPEERALPIVTRVLTGNGSDQLKTRALFVLGQIDLPGARSLLLDMAENSSGELRNQSIRMIGISGDPTAMAGLADIYDSGDSDIKESVLNAYLIAGRSDAVYQIAANTNNEEEFEMAVRTLGAMGASEELQKLRKQKGNTESLIRAASISGDYATLLEIALHGSSPQQQVQAIQNLGVVGGDAVNTALVDIYRNADTGHIRNAALHAMMISGYEEGVVELFKTSQDIEEKRQLLHMLVAMDSEAMLDIIDATLGDGQ